MDKAHNAPGCTAKSKRTALSCARGKRFEGLPDAGARGGAPEGERNGLIAMARGQGNYRAEKAHSEIGLAVMFARTVSLRL